MPEPSKPLLVFPAGYGDGPQVAQLARTLGLDVIGASSVAGDPAAADHQTWLTLPHVSDAAFDSALSRAIEAHGIGRIHASHYAAWFYLKDALPRLAPQVALSLGRSNFDLQADYAALRRTVDKAPAIPELAKATEPAPAPSLAARAGMLRAAMAIPGESYEPKLLALIEVGRHIPKGDIVEIGCLFGRTAALLAMLAQAFDLGNILCIDPWSAGETNQGNARLQAASVDFAWDSYHQIFEINVAPFAAGRLNYIHAASTKAAPLYGPSCVVETEAFGRSTYEGRIALLHIDGNHEYEHALADARDWIPHVRPGGWIVLDDYHWDWGDGPRRVGDAFLRDEAVRVRCAFVAGGALFIQLKD